MVISSLTGGYNATNKCTQYKPLSVEWYKNSINIATLYTIGYHPDLYNKLANKKLPLICTNPITRAAGLGPVLMRAVMCPVIP